MNGEAVAAAPVMPPVERLLALMEPDPTLLARVALAWAGGYRWIRFETSMPGWRLDGGRAGQARIYDNGVVNTDTLPNPFSDSAAAWELMVRERVALGPHDLLEPSAGWTAVAHIGNWTLRVADPARALAVAVLHKHKDGTLSPLIRPLLTRLEMTS